MFKFQICVVKSQEGFRVGLLRHPRHGTELLVDGQKGLIVCAPLVSSKAHEILRLWEDRMRGRWRHVWWSVLSRKHQQYQRSSLCVAERDLSEDEVLIRIKEMLQGRILSEQRLVSVLRQEGYWPSDISRALDLGVHRAELNQVPGFATGAWGSKICSRCQSEDAKTAPCLVCGNQDCFLCMACKTMGENRSCSTLLTLAVPNGRRNDGGGSGSAELRLAYELTTSQRDASNELLRFWEQEEGKALVWAACGAGKTEVTFALIQRVLREGGDVLFAIPRQDIVREMTERLRSAFPDVTVASHYGGQPWLAPGTLVVATTHQVLHFYQRFDLAILDEVDAFPYQGNEMLRLGLLRALLPKGKLVEMTATPHSHRDYDRVITIPARYHGFALPEPRLLKLELPHWNKLEPADLSSSLMEMLQDNRHPWLVFAPTIAACSRLQETLTKALGKTIGVCHSKAPDRSETVQGFKDGKLDIVVTTSVLERGVNFPGVGVIVLYADHAVFPVSALVQIAGRVGRTAESPSGTVIFAGSHITRPMKKSLELIRKLNRQARERGLLYNETTW